MLMAHKYHVPADVPDELIETFIDNMDAATCGTGKMNLFACDQKIPHRVNVSAHHVFAFRVDFYPTLRW